MDAIRPLARGNAWMKSTFSAHAFAIAMLLMYAGLAQTGTALDNQSILAIRFRSGTPAEKMDAIATQLREKLKVRVTSGPLFLKYHLIALGPSSRHDLGKSALHAIRSTDPGLEATLVQPILVHGNQVIPTGELIVKLKPGITLEIAKDTLLRLHLIVIQAIGSSPEGPFVLRNSEDRIKASLESAETLKVLGLVQYARPNYLEPVGFP